MVEFNPDGSLKLPDALARKRQAHAAKLKAMNCIRIKKEIVSSSAPKKCMLHIEVSAAITDMRFIDFIYRQFNDQSSTPSKLRQVSEKGFEVELGSDFRRCTDCCSLVRRYREFLDGNVIEDMGSCSFEQRDFSYEDYFE